MRRLVTVVFATLVIAMLATSGVAAHGHARHTGNPCGPGRLVVNINHKVINDLDAGFQGGWAYDAYKRQIKVWQTGPNTFCATARYEGKFVTIPGQTSPGEGSTNVFASAVKGTFHGGYLTNHFTATLNPSPAHPTRGNIGTFDYACDLDFNCNPFSWPETYFSNLSGQELEWWGFAFRFRHQVWVNSIDGAFGDITG